MKRKFQHYIDLIIVLTQKELKVRYKNAFLVIYGQWASRLLLPQFFIAFKVVMKVPVEDYTLLLFLIVSRGNGLLIQLHAANSVSGECIANKKVNFPRSMMPFSQVLQDMIHLIFRSQ